jgi:hypothetical protein
VTPSPKNAWFDCNFIQAYRKVGHRNPKRDSAAEAFLRENAPRYAADEDVMFATHFVSGTGNWLSSRNLAAVGSAIESTTWIDPSVRLLLAGEEDCAPRSSLWPDVPQRLRQPTYPRSIALRQRFRARLEPSLPLRRPDGGTGHNRRTHPPRHRPDAVQGIDQPHLAAVEIRHAPAPLSHSCTALSGDFPDELCGHAGQDP